jgi:hypothetical protein
MKTFTVEGADEGRGFVLVVRGPRKIHAYGHADVLGDDGSAYDLYVSVGGERRGKIGGGWPVHADGKVLLFTSAEEASEVAECLWSQPYGGIIDLFDDHQRYTFHAVPAPEIPGAMAYVSPYRE